MTSQVRHHPPGPLHNRRERGEIPGKIKTCGFGDRASGKTGTKGKERKLGSRLRKTGLLVDEQTPSPPPPHLCLPRNLRTSLAPSSFALATPPRRSSISLSLSSSNDRKKAQFQFRAPRVSFRNEYNYTE